MSTSHFAAFSDNAIMFAGIVFVLAVLGHLVEWAASLTTTKAESSRPAARVPAASSHPGAADHLESSHADQDSASSEADEKRRLRIETAGRIGVALTLLATVLLG